MGSIWMLRKEKFEKSLKMTNLVSAMFDGVFHERKLNMPLDDRTKYWRNIREVQEENASARGVTGSWNGTGIPKVFGKLLLNRIRARKRRGGSWHYLSSCLVWLKQSFACVCAHASRNSSSLGCTY